MSEEKFNSSIEIKDWRQKHWKFNYTKHATTQGWSVDWQVLTPKGEVKAFKLNDLKLAERCLDESGTVNQILLEYEAKWWVNHYTNLINIKVLKAEQQAVLEEK